MTTIACACRDPRAGCAALTTVRRPSGMPRKSLSGTTRSAWLRDRGAGDARAGRPRPARVILAERHAVVCARHLHGEAPEARQAVRADAEGAFDFLTKPVAAGVLLAAVAGALRTGSGCSRVPLQRAPVPGASLLSRPGPARGPDAPPRRASRRRPGDEICATWYFAVCVRDAENYAAESSGLEPLAEAARRPRASRGVKAARASAPRAQKRRLAHRQALEHGDERCAQARRASHRPESWATAPLAARSVISSPTSTQASASSSAWPASTCHMPASRSAAAVPSARSS